VKLGFYVTGSATGGYAELVDQIEYADRSGFDSVWLRERHFHRDHQGRNFFSSPMVAAAFIAARTRSVRIGLGARILPLDHPVHVAEDAATIDLLSEGRLDLGIARIGENDLYQGAFGCDPAKSRGRFEESIDLIVRAWTGEPFSWSGRHYTVPEVAVLPRPAQRPHPPIYLVGISESTLSFGAERAMPLLLAAAQPEDEVGRTISGYRDRLAAAGADPASVSLPLNRFVYVAETTERARAEMGRAVTAFLDRPASVIRDFLGSRAADAGDSLLYEEVFICGDAAHCTERIEGLRDRLGVDELLLTFNYFTLEHDRCLASMQRFVSEVMPWLRAAADGAGPAAANDGTASAARTPSNDDGRVQAVEG
jgi:alkanesulfonate monooxygenase SsuD/methylene tetrahydromethanopterin reductase-like flavin-dependent oxidoreductase (luciferase family)